MANMEAVIRKHNNAILTKYAKQLNMPRHDNNQQNIPRNRNIQRNAITDSETGNKCNCRQRNLCPLNGNCLVKSVIYQAEVKQENTQPKTYIGVTSDEFKTRY